MLGALSCATASSPPGTLPLTRFLRPYRKPLCIPRRRWGSPLLPAAASSAADASGETGGSPPPEVDSFGRSGASEDAYLALFVRMLGLDYEDPDRELAITTIWKYAQGGRKSIDAIMKFPGFISLVINLLKSDSALSSEAAAGLLVTITSVKIYRDHVVGCGVVEEISSVLNENTISAEMKERCLCVLWNLSIDDDTRLKIAYSDIFIKIIAYLSDEEGKLRESAGGIIANLALTPSIHSLLVEGGVIQKLANILKNKDEGKVIRKEARNALLELSNDYYNRILITEEGLVRVPLLGTAAYKDYRPLKHSWPSLPDGTEIERSSQPSRYGASELLIGLSIRENNIELEEAKMNAIVGRSNQQFLARIGAIEMEEKVKDQTGSVKCEQYTLLHWLDGVARLNLMLGLDDVRAVIRAAYSIADAAVNVQMCISFREAGVVSQLVHLLHHEDGAVKEAAAHALDKLCVSSLICESLEAEGAMKQLSNILKDPEVPFTTLEKSLSIIYQIFDTKCNVGVLEDAVSCDGTCDSSTLSSSNPSTEERNLSVVSEVVLRFVDILREGPPNLQSKSAYILNYLAAFECHATSMVAARIGTVLDSVLEVGTLEGLTSDDGEVSVMTVAEVEDIGQIVSSATMLLTKLLNFDLFYRSIRPERTTALLRQLLKSGLPLHSKERIASCLMKLEQKMGSPQNLDSSPAQMDVIIYETIPRLVNQLNSTSDERRCTAAAELNKIVSHGVAEYTAAVANSGGIHPLVNLIEEGNEALESSLAVLHNLSMDPENHSAIIAAGAVPALKRIILTKQPQWFRALQVLQTLPT